MTEKVKIDEKESSGHVFDNTCPAEPGSFCLTGVDLVLYQEPMDLVRAFWKSAFPERPVLTDQDVLETLDENKGGSEISAKEQLEHIREQGIWSYADVSENTVHIWMEPDVSLVLVTHAIAHELGHLLMSIVDRDDGNSVYIDDMVIPIDAYVVDMFGWVARQTNLWVCEMDDYFSAREEKEGDFSC